MKRRIREDEETGELNIVPYLDVVVNLVMFMLLSMTGLITPRRAQRLGAQDRRRGRRGGRRRPRQGPKLLLTVAIGKQGFYIAGAGGVLGLGRQRDRPDPPAHRAAQGRRQATTTGALPAAGDHQGEVPQRDAGDPLGRRGRRLRRPHPDHGRLPRADRRSAGRRKTERKPLFFDVSLSVIG